MCPQSPCKTQGLVAPHLGTKWDDLSPQCSNPAQHRRKFPQNAHRRADFFHFCPVSCALAGRTPLTSTQSRLFHVTTPRSLGALHVATEIGPRAGSGGVHRHPPTPTHTGATSANHGHPVHPFTDTFLLSPSFQGLKHGYRFTLFLWLREAQWDYSK